MTRRPTGSGTGSKTPDKAATGGAGRPPEAAGDLPPYVLDDQIGFVLRRAQQRHLGIFAAAMPGALTAQQFAALAKLAETGPCSQNALGRLTAMDNATISGVLNRLAERGLIARVPLAEDRRMLEAQLAPAGRALLAEALPAAMQITADTLAPLTRSERTALIALLRKIG